MNRSGTITLSALLVLAAALASGRAAEVPANEQSLESTRAILAEWVETQQVISREKEDWQVGKELLEQRIDLIQGEIGALEEKIGLKRQSITEADEKRRALVDENDALKAATASLTAEIALVETKTRNLLERLPDPIRERVTPLARRLPTDPNNSDQSLGERFQNVIGILNEVNKFNREITMASEVRTLPDGSTTEVKALYIGVSLGYYVTPDGNAAGVGQPTPEGWSWQPANELAGDIARAIAILNNEDVPAYVPLPVSFQ
jgi:hypothetical protein